MTNPWFRLYAEFSHDPKVQMMSEAMQRRYIMVMCMRCSNVLVTLHETEIAFHLRISDVELAETKALFVAKGFIDDQWNVLNWDKRQFKSDSSAERVAKHRENKKVSCNGDVTLQKQEANVVDTDTDTEVNLSNTDVLLVAVKKPGDSLVSKVPDCPHQEILSLFAKHLPELPQAVTWDGQRATNLRSRWRWLMTAKKSNGVPYAANVDEALAWFERFFGYVAGSDFLTGRNGKWTNCDLGWLMKAENFNKVMQGNYENKEAA